MKRPEFIRVENYLTNVLLRDLVGHDRSPSAFLVYLCLYADTYGESRRSVRVSLAKLAERTGLSKSAVQSALRVLARRHLIRTQRASRTAIPEYFVNRTWVR